MKNGNSHSNGIASSRVKIISREFEKLPEDKKKELVNTLDSTIDVYLNAIGCKKG